MCKVWYAVDLCYSIAYSPTCGLLARPLRTSVRLSFLLHLQSNSCTLSNRFKDYQTVVFIIQWPMHQSTDSTKQNILLKSQKNNNSLSHLQQQRNHGLEQTFPLSLPIPGHPVYQIVQTLFDGITGRRNGGKN